MLIPVIRHGFTFWEAPRCNDVPLEERTTRGLHARSNKNGLTAGSTKSSPLLAETPALPPALPVGPQSPPEGTPPEVQAIQKTVMEVWNLEPAYFFSNNRHQHIAIARMTSIALCRTLCPDHSAESIARAHYRVHGSVNHACEQVENWREIDPKFRDRIVEIESKLLALN